ncbi:MAG: cell division protein FtsX [Bacteroidetes bacterium]|jgi:cell division transport system permease protein|nr:cell division protein FtsX [Bacteroidota bacterium]MBK6818722.1 cell division protein FtsX [Bacteroidota bacterium]MBK7040064.1 cell division protein FtsX [Bacteroidota bacterium]MBK8330249.1 cell division protein FtsX [Bacteroidota bacterium]MBK9299878.1 cell division protein FtsX [Bacteroidota bacterium]
MNTDPVVNTKIKKGKATYAYSIIGVALVLFLLGSLGWLVINAGELSKSFKENIEISVILNDNTRDEMAVKLKEIIDKQAFTKSSQYITKDKAAEQFKKDFGEDFLQVLDYNPLYTSVNFHLHSGYMNTDSLIKIEKFLYQSNVVREVFYQKNLVDIMNSNVRRIGIVILAISLFLIFSVIILIDNTIRLAMFSNRFLIKTMQMVGATRWFIAKPFNIRGVINGIISALIAIAGILVLKFVAESWLPELRTLANTKWLIILCLSILAMGIIISLLSTHRSVIKYLRTQLDDLY